MKRAFATRKFEKWPGVLVALAAGCASAAAQGNTAYREVIAFGQVDLAPKYIMAGEVY